MALSQSYPFDGGFSQHCIEWNATTQEYQVYTEHLYPEDYDCSGLRTYTDRTDAELDYQLRCALHKNTLSQFL
jgi:hypothetical protein